MAGYLLGGFVFGLLTDKLGRKPTFLIANSLMAVGGLAAAAAPEFFTFVAARVLVGFSIAGVEAACFVMGMEMVSCELPHIVCIVLSRSVPASAPWPGSSAGSSRQAAS